MQQGRLYLFPIEITEDGMSTILTYNISLIHDIKHYIVERARTARRFISRTSPPHPISDIEVIEIDEQGDNIRQCISWLKSGYDVGVMSESGMPGIADPGQKVVAAAHKEGIKVIPLVGPNSIMLALSASGMSGQNFAFNGYLPIKENELRPVLKQLENQILKRKQTQIFIETPYRNDRLLNNLINQLNPNIKLCIAKDITGVEEIILTKTIDQWKKEKISIGKWPTIFIIGM
jgi:16S rRNA (cytidine1402-2'-O)-methyltransferase